MPWYESNQPLKVDAHNPFYTGTMEEVSQEAAPDGAPDQSTAKTEAEAYLGSLINKTFRVYTTDSRLFVGAFKCTDPNSNIVLSLTNEYRQPSQQKLAEAMAAAGSSETVKAEMTSRYLGLVVVPGKHITKIEVEEFISQMKDRSIPERANIYQHA